MPTIYELLLSNELPSRSTTHKFNAKGSSSKPVVSPSFVMPHLGRFLWTLGGQQSQRPPDLHSPLLRGPLCHRSRVKTYVYIFFDAINLFLRGFCRLEAHAQVNKYLPRNEGGGGLPQRTKCNCNVMSAAAAAG